MSKSAAGRRRIRAVAQPAPQAASESEHRSLPSPPSSYHYPPVVALPAASRSTSPSSRQANVSFSPLPFASRLRSESPSAYSPSRGYPSPPLSDLSGFTAIRNLPFSPTQTSPVRASFPDQPTIKPQPFPQKEDKRPKQHPTSPDAKFFPPPGRSTLRPSAESPKFKLGGKKKSPEDKALAAEVPKKQQSRFKALLKGEKKKKKKLTDDVPTPFPPPVPPLPALLSEATQSKGTYVVNDLWLKKHDTTVHPYQAEVPYPQGYDFPILENDLHTDLLLNRLRSGSPLFCDAGSVPPRTVLDLGCGKGHWVLDAARAWENYGTIVTGFDLVDVTRGTWPRVQRNFRLVRGNFLNNPLPFPNESFDVVRMANLTLCIPYDQWYFVLSEVFRVLSYGGRLELIDDEIIFSYGRDLCPPKSSLAPKINIPIPSSTFSLSSLKDSNGNPVPSPDEDPYDGYLSDSDAGRNTSSSPRPGSLTEDSRSTNSSTGQRSSSVRYTDPRASAWDVKAATSQGLETIFENMLRQRLGIHPRPSEFILDVIKGVFGKRRVGLLKSMHLKLAPSELDWKRLYGAGSPSSYVGPSHIPQATMAAAAAAVNVRRPSISSGTLPDCPGLVLWPSTFVPIPKAELEMHAVKHANTLLGCKPAIADYVELNEDGIRVVDEEFWDALYDYEAFIKDRFHKLEQTSGAILAERRRRNRDSITSEISQDMHQYQSMFQDSFHWSPSGEDSPIEHPSTPRSGPRHGFRTEIEDDRSTTNSCGEAPPYTKEDLPHVRTIRVYEAIKTMDVGLQ